MFRVLFLLLIVMSSVAFAQIEEKPQAVKIDEFEKATNGYVKMKMDYFLVQLANNPNAQGYIINYGTDRDVAIRERQFQQAITFLKIDPIRLTIIRGGFRGVVKSEVWLVPAGADNPKIESSSQLVDEMVKPTEEDLRTRLDIFCINIANNSELQGYIVNYGTAKQITIRENEIKKYITYRKFDLTRIKFINGGYQKEIKTQLYIDSSKNKETDKK